MKCTPYSTVLKFRNTYFRDGYQIRDYYSHSSERPDMKHKEW